MSTEAPVRPATRRRRQSAQGGAPIDTRDLILETAERLFAERGFAGVSVRDVTAAAGANIAAINYHFGAKDRLLFEIFRRRAGELNELRHALLAETLAKGPPRVRDVLHALLSPTLRWRDPALGRVHAIRFLSRSRLEGTAQIKRVIDNRVEHLAPFRDALMKALPHLSKEDVCWRLHYTLTAAHHVNAELERLVNLSEGACDPFDYERGIDRLVDFAAAGFLANAPTPERAR